jgi:hypothetical protein
MRNHLIAVRHIYHRGTGQARTHAEGGGQKLDPDPLEQFVGVQRRHRV